MSLEGEETERVERDRERMKKNCVVTIYRQIHSSMDWQVSRGVEN